MIAIANVELNRHTRHTATTTQFKKLLYHSSTINTSWSETTRTPAQITQTGLFLTLKFLFFTFQYPTAVTIGQAQFVSFHWIAKETLINMEIT